MESLLKFKILENSGARRKLQDVCLFFGFYARLPTKNVKKFLKFEKET